MTQAKTTNQKKGLKLDGVFDLSKLGIVLLILAAVIAIGFAIFAIAKSMANDGVVGVQDAIGSMNESVYNDYDQKTVSGTQVLSSYNQMNGKPVAIIVKTCKGEWVNYNALVSPFSSGTGISQTAAPFSGISKDATSKQYSSSVSYFDKTSASAEVNLVMSTDADIGKRVVIYNNVTTNMQKSGNSNYVTGTAKFSSYLVRDPGDTIIGIVFIQQGKHTVGT